MTATELLAYLKSQGIELWFKGDKLGYRGRKVTLPPGLVVLLRQHKTELMQLLSGAQGTVPAEQFPLSHSQKSFWFLYQMNPASAAYNVAYSAALRGPIDIPALRKAFEKLSQRHPVLRTRFVMSDGIPWQEVHGLPTCALTVLDATGWTAKELNERVQAELQTPFDLLQDPPARFYLYQRPRRESVLFVCLHHIHVDGWSLAILVRELAALYRGAVTRQPVPLPAIHTTYADFVVWQQQRLLSEEGQAQLRYWLGELAGPLPTLELPSDRPRPGTRGESGATAYLRLDADLSKRLKSLTVQQGTTMYALLLAAFAALLHRYSRQEDFVIGSPFHGRHNPRFNQLVGCLINSLAIRVRVTPEMKFSALLADVYKRSYEAVANADYPFPLLVEQLHPERDPSRTPIFQVLFAYENFFGADVMSPGAAETVPTPQAEPLFGVAMEALPISQMEGQFDLGMNIVEGGDSLSCGLTYNTELFDTSTITRMAGHFVELLHGVVAEPEQFIAQLPLLTAAERQLVELEWNQTQTAYPATRSVHGLFEAQVERSPDAVAVVFAEQRLTYRELDARANQLAHHLRTLGVGPDVLVGLYLERSLEMVIGLLGVLKAGGAYVPLDPDYPAELLTFMLQDAQPCTIITSSRLASRGLLKGIPIVDCEADAARLMSYPSSRPAELTQAHHLIYVLYTSGSTGRPKGVANIHGGLCNRLLWMQSKYVLGPSDRVLQKTPYSFDVSGWEFFWPLITGAQLVFVRPGGHRDPDYLARLIAKEQITTLHFVPSMFAVFLEHSDLESLCASLRQVFCSGEALLPEQVQRFYAKVPQAQLHNLYGPTEASIDVAYYACQAGRQQVAIPIGRPIANTQLYLLDQQQQVVPIGVPGEIYIGGVGLARGYLNRPELTAEKFIRSPFSADATARLYKTGDLGRFLPDGNIEFLGRLDYQVKIRGFRVELGGIEAVLGSHPTIRACAVLLRQDSPGDKRLCAYVVFQPDTPLDARPDTQSLRQHLGRTLPEYMVPAAFVFLPALPLTPSGKLDRKALPAPLLDRGPASYVAPRTPMEIALAQLFGSVLHLDRISLHDDFFAIGGHSLLATQLVSRIRSVLGFTLPLRDLFTYPRLESLAAWLDSHYSDAAQPVEPIPILARDAPLPLSFAQQRLWFMDQLQPQSALYNLPVALRLTGSLDLPVLQRALTEILNRHEALRTCFPIHEGTATQRILPAPDPLPLPLFELRDTPQESVQAQLVRRMTEEALTPFNLITGPLFRTAVLRLAPGSHVLLLSMHHIVSDGWSLGVFGHELSALYAAFRAQLPSPLPPLPVQLADVAAWERAQSTSPPFLAQLAYWQTQLQGCLPLELPTDRPRPAVFSDRGHALPVVFPAALTAALQRLSTEHGATLFMTVLAAWNVLLARYSGQTDLCVGTPIAHRTRTETESLIGCFVNTLVIRTQVELGQNFGELLAQVRRTSLAAYAHQDVPFERVVESLGVARDLSRNPLFQVMLVFQNASQFAPTLPELMVEVLEIDNPPAKFELTMALAESADGSLRGALGYARDLWEPATIERLVGHLLTLLRAIVAAPATPLQALPLLADAERHQLLVGWNQTAVDFAEARCVHGLFEAQVARSPDAVAVVFAEQQLTYRELDARANQLGHHLRTLGVGPDVLVGVYLERSLEMVIALLGILKAGGAYVPLDPEYPADLLTYMLQDARPGAVVTSSQLAARGLLKGVPLVDFDADAARLASYPSSRPPDLAQAQHLIYVLYTSGSTGRPKGVANIHSGLCNRLLWMKSKYALGPADRVLQKTPYSFDVSGWEFFWPLITGAQLVLARPGGHRDPDYLARLIAQEQITTVHFVPSMFAVFLEHSGLESLCASLRQVFCSGEALLPEHVQRFYAKVPQAQLHNLYGPTEASIEVSYYACQAKGQESAIPIGRPIANTQLYVLDSQLQVVPVGVPGEIHIGGVGLARGYHKLPELTAQKFIRNPFATDAGARLYKTGDRGRFLPDGNIEFLGRIDHQVKLRGFRIELGGIETVLGAHPAISACTVVLREDTPGDKRLCAYVVLQPDAPPSSRLDPQALRGYLARTLPDYMLPTTFVFLAALPLTPSGKLDRRALPAPAAASGPDTYAAPRTHLERILVEVFVQVLQLERVGIHDDFFARGGHSLLAVRLVALVAQRTGQALALSTIFQRSTVAAIAGQLHDQLPLPATVLPLHSAGSKPPLFCVHPVGGNVLCYIELARTLGVDQPLYGVQATPVSALDDAPVESLDEVAARYVGAITKVQPTGPYHLLGWSLGGVLAFAMAQKLRESGHEVALLALLDSYPPERSATPGAEPVSPNESQLLSGFLRDLLQPSPQASALGVLSDAALDLGARLELLRGQGLLPPDADPQQLARLYALFRRNLQLLRGHHPGSYPGPLVLLRASESPGTDAADHGWGAFCTGPLEVVTAPGNHYSLLTQPNVRVVADLLAARIGGKPNHSAALPQGLQGVNPAPAATDPDRKPGNDLVVHLHAMGGFDRARPGRCGAD